MKHFCCSGLYGNKISVSYGVVLLKLEAFIIL
jgi:hypothetical protein